MMIIHIDVLLAETPRDTLKKQQKADQETIAALNRIVAGNYQIESIVSP